ncbi:MAG: polar growth protein [Chaenotheca gracillima]|nr:MAG: polar growth protein [Chaenotheca gracillima]
MASTDKDNPKRANDDVVPEGRKKQNSRRAVENEVAKQADIAQRQADIARREFDNANSTVHTFLGDRQKSWMTNFNPAAAAVESNSSRQASSTSPNTPRNTQHKETAGSVRRNPISNKAGALAIAGNEPSQSDQADLRDAAASAPPSFSQRASPLEGHRSAVQGINSLSTTTPLQSTRGNALATSPLGSSVPSQAPAAQLNQSSTPLPVTSGALPSLPFSHHGARTQAPLESTSAQQPMSPPAAIPYAHSEAHLRTSESDRRVAAQQFSQSSQQMSTSHGQISREGRDSPQTTRFGPIPEIPLALMSDVQNTMQAHIARTRRIQRTEHPFDRQRINFLERSSSILDSTSLVACELMCCAEVHPSRASSILQDDADLVAGLYQLSAIFGDTHLISRPALSWMASFPASQSSLRDPTTFWGKILNRLKAWLSGFSEKWGAMRLAFNDRPPLTVDLAEMLGVESVSLQRVLSRFFVRELCLEGEMPYFRRLEGVLMRSQSEYIRFLNSQRGRQPEPRSQVIIESIEARRDFEQVRIEQLRARNPQHPPNPLRHSLLVFSPFAGPVSGEQRPPRGGNQPSGLRRIPDSSAISTINQRVPQQTRLPRDARVGNPSTQTFSSLNTSATPTDPQRIIQSVPAEVVFSDQNMQQPPRTSFAMSRRLPFPEDLSLSSSDSVGPLPDPFPELPPINPLEEVVNADGLLPDPFSKWPQLSASRQAVDLDGSRVFLPSSVTNRSSEESSPAIARPDKYLASGAQNRREMLYPPLDTPFEERRRDVKGVPLMDSLLDAHLRSPHLVPADSASGNVGKFYQQVIGFAMEPALMPMSTSEFFRPNFEVDKDTFRNKLKRVDPAQPGDRFTRHYRDGSLLFRLRCCTLESANELSAHHDWMLREHSFPDFMVMKLNNEFLDPRYKRNHGADLPVDVTDFINEGQNQMWITLWRKGWEKKTLFAWAVEIIEITSHEKVLQTCLQANLIPAEQGLEAICSMLTSKPDEGPNVEDEEIEMVRDQMTISITDPFTSRMFEIPVRGPSCRHRDCFDLETFLRTRRIYQHYFPRRDYPSAVDDWKCPLCGRDARPLVLQVDGFLTNVRAQLVERGLPGTKAIIVTKDGTWTPKPVRPNETASDRGRVERARTVDMDSTHFSASRAKNPGSQVVIDLDDEDD